MSENENNKTEDTRDSADKKKDNERKKRIAYVLGIIVMVILLLLLVRGCTTNGGGVSIRNAEGNVQDLLNSTAEKSRLWVSAANTMTSEDGTTVVAYDMAGNKLTILDNVERNHMSLDYQLLDADGKVLYQSPVLTPGTGIDEAKLNTKLSPGTYDIRAVAKGYDSETNLPTGGTVAADIKLIVK